MDSEISQKNFVVSYDKESEALPHRGQMHEPIREYNKTDSLTREVGMLDNMIPKAAVIRNLECKTVSIVGIPSEIKEESVLLNDIQTCTSPKPRIISEEQIERKKKTKRFKGYYKYSMGDNNGSSIENVLSSEEKSIVSDSCRIMSDPLDDVSDVSEQKVEKTVLNELNKLKTETFSQPECSYERSSASHKIMYKFNASIDQRLNNILEEQSCSSGDYRKLELSRSKQVDCKYFKLLRSSSSDYGLQVIRNWRYSPSSDDKDAKTVQRAKSDKRNKNNLRNEPKNKQIKNRTEEIFISKSDVDISYSYSKNKNNRPQSKSGIPVFQYPRLDRGCSPIKIPVNRLSPEKCSIFHDNHKTSFSCLRKMDKKLGTDRERDIVNEKCSTHILHSPQHTEAKLNTEKSSARSVKVKTVDVGIGVDMYNEKINRIQCFKQKAIDIGVGVNIPVDCVKSRNWKGSGKKILDSVIESHVQSPRLLFSDFAGGSEKSTTTTERTPREGTKSHRDVSRGILKNTTTNVHKNHDEASLDSSPRNQIFHTQDSVNKNKDLKPKTNRQVSPTRSPQNNDGFDTSFANFKAFKSADALLTNLKISKSDTNIRHVTIKDDSKVASLVCLHRFDQKFTRLTGSSRSTFQSDNFYVRSVINDTPHKSTLFLTKTYRSSNMSSYQRRKLYDDHIRRRMKRKMQISRNLAPQVFEVRFLHVEPFSSQSNGFERDGTTTDSLNLFQDFSKENVVKKTPVCRSFKNTTSRKAFNQRECVNEVVRDVDSLWKSRKKVCPETAIQEIKKSEKNVAKRDAATNETSPGNSENISEHDSTLDNCQSIIEENIVQLVQVIRNSIISQWQTIPISENPSEETKTVKIYEAADFKNESSFSENTQSISDLARDSKGSQENSFGKHSSCFLFGPSDSFTCLDESDSIKPTILGFALHDGNEGLHKLQKRAPSDTPHSEDSGYKSKSSSISDFFKRPHIAALLNPSVDSELYKGSKCSSYNEMTKQCQEYAKKVKMQSESEVDVQVYEEITLDVLLGRNSFSTLDNFNSKCSLCKENSLQITEELDSDSKSYISHYSKATDLSQSTIGGLSNETENTIKELVPEELSTLKENQSKMDIVQSVITCNVTFSNTNLNNSCITLIQSSSVKEVDSNNSLHSAEHLMGRNSQTEGTCADNPIILRNTAKQFFEKLLAMYEKEIAASTSLYYDSVFFEDELLKFVGARVGKNDSKIKKRGTLKSFIARKYRSCLEKFFHSRSFSKKTEGPLETLTVYKQGTDFNSEHQETLKVLAQNAHKYFSMFVQAVRINKNINDEIKINGLQKLLERIENGQFTFLKSDYEVDFEEEMRQQVKEAFSNIFITASKEAKKINRTLSLNDMKLIGAFVCKYRIGMLSKTDLIASYIGRGLLKDEKDLKAAVTYLMRQPAIDIDLKAFEEFCKMTTQNK